MKISTLACRIAAATAVSLAVVVLAGCSSASDESASYRERGYPTAPAQVLPATDRGGVDLANGPLADLPYIEWVTATAQRTSIPQRVLAAYAGASLRMSVDRPSCGIGWNSLAGIGAVESIHGRYGGASIDAEGIVSPPITGVPLDGGDGVMAIPDTDGGALDGDDEWDRAVGPMQFIPTTWEQYAQDGNNDGETDPHQIDDAVLTAAVYLCERGEDLTTDGGWNTAITAYNQSKPYAHDVAERASAFADTPTASD